MQPVEGPAERDLPAHDLQLQDLGGLRAKERLTSEELVGHRAERVEVGPRVDPPAGGLLGRHVVHLALDGAGPGPVAAVHAAGDAEVGQLDDPLVVDEHVVRADVPVHHVELATAAPAEAVHVDQGREQLTQHVVGGGPREGAAALGVVVEQVSEVAKAALDELHRDELLSVGLADVEHPHDVTVLEQLRDPPLITEHADEVAVFREVLVQDLQGDNAALSRPAERFGAVHGRHAAGGQPLDDGVVPHGTLVTVVAHGVQISERSLAS